MKKILILFIFTVIIGSYLHSKSNVGKDCPKSIETISMCQKYDSVRYLIYKLNFIDFLKERKESILQCQLYFNAPLLRSDTMILSFLMLKEDKPVQFRRFRHSFYFVNNSLKLIGVDDGGFISVEEDLFETNKNEFNKYINDNQQSMSNEFRSVWQNMQHIKN